MPNMREDLLTLLRKTNGVANEQAVDRILETWRTNKAPLLNLLGEDYRMVIPVGAREIAAFPVQEKITLGDVQLMVSRTLEKNADCAAYAERITSNLWFLLGMLETGEVARNITRREHHLLMLPFRLNYTATGRHRVVVGEKLKLGRALGNAMREHMNLFSEVPEAVKTLLIDVFGQILSQVTQRLQIRAQSNVVITLNPVEMLMTSLNTSGWWSCHNIINGQSRTAPMTYVMDKHTILAYAYEREARFEQLDRDLPVKTWRMVSHFSEERKSLVFSSQFPQRNESIVAVAREALIDLFGRAYNMQGDGRIYVPNNRPTGTNWVYADIPTGGYSFDGNPQPQNFAIGGDATPICLGCGCDRTNHNMGTYYCGNCSTAATTALKKAAG